MNYVGALPNYIRHTLFLLNPTNLDEDSVQATRIERRGNHMQEDHPKKNHKFTGKGKENNIDTMNKEGEKIHCTNCEKDGHDRDRCWKLHLKRMPKFF